MRALKFRAWDKEASWEYFVFDQLCELSREELEETIGIGSPIYNQIVKENRLDFSRFGQFTGLRDKTRRRFMKAAL